MAPPPQTLDRRTVAVHTSGQASLPSPVGGWLGRPRADRTSEFGQLLVHLALVLLFVAPGPARPPPTLEQEDQRQERRLASEPDPPPPPPLGGCSRLRLLGRWPVGLEIARSALPWVVAATLLTATRRCTATGVVTLSLADISVDTTGRGVHIVPRPALRGHLDEPPGRARHPAAGNPGPLPRLSGHTAGHRCADGGDPGGHPRQRRGHHQRGDGTRPTGDPRRRAWTRLAVSLGIVARLRAIEGLPGGCPKGALPAWDRKRGPSQPLGPNVTKAGRRYGRNVPGHPVPEPLSRGSRRADGRCATRVYSATGPITDRSGRPPAREPGAAVYHSWRCQYEPPPRRSVARVTGRRPRCSSGWNFRVPGSMPPCSALPGHCCGGHQLVTGIQFSFFRGWVPLTCRPASCAVSFATVATTSTHGSWVATSVRAQPPLRACALESPT